MKNLIITTAMVIFILTVMGWQLKLGETLHQKQRLQYAAEEAAAAARSARGFPRTESRRAAWSGTKSGPGRQRKRAFA